MQARYLRFGYKRHGPLGVVVTGIALLLLMLASPLVLAKPNKCENNPDRDYADCRTYYFIFGGQDSFFPENDNGFPWQKGYEAPSELIVPLSGEKIAAIGDVYQPCGLSDPFSCENRLIEHGKYYGYALEAHGLSFRPGFEDGPGMMFNFRVQTPLVQYRYTVDSWAFADMALWDTSQQDFCVPMQFHSVWIRQSEPTVRQRNKQCRENIHFEVCEADVNETGQDVLLADFWAVIWRKDYPGWEESPDYPLNPPCPNPFKLFD